MYSVPMIKDIICKDQNLNPGFEVQLADQHNADDHQDTNLSSVHRNLWFFQQYLRPTA